MANFSFGFSGDDIDHGSDNVNTNQNASTAPRLENTAAAAVAFPVSGKPQLPPTQHDLSQLLYSLPSKISYSLLETTLDDGTTIRLPRRELWDVRVQLMAEDRKPEASASAREDSDGSEAGLGNYDVKTGIYEGGFKSWESSIDLVKILATESLLMSRDSGRVRIIELGCGTALPSLAVFQWVMAMSEVKQQFSFILADYNPSVLRLVTLPNLVLTWALHHRQSTDLEADPDTDGELYLDEAIIEEFQAFLTNRSINMSFISGAWSPEFVQLLYCLPASSAAGSPPSKTLLLGAETIYSPFALQAFLKTLFSILERERGHDDTSAAAIVAAKRVYFGVGGSLDDFIADAQTMGGLVSLIREEAGGIARGVVRCTLANSK